MNKIFKNTLLCLACSLSWSLADPSEINENEFHLLKTEDKYFVAHNNRAFIFGISFLQKDLTPEWKKKIFGYMTIYFLDEKGKMTELMVIKTDGKWWGDPNNLNKVRLSAKWDKTPWNTELKKGNYYLVPKIYIPKEMPSDTSNIVEAIEKIKK